MEHPGHPEEGVSIGEPLVSVGSVRLGARVGVGEDYSARRRPRGVCSGFPHDHARSRAYRWNEGRDGGHGRLRPAWRRPAVERPRPDPQARRMFGLTNSEGNHGEDVKEYWWDLGVAPEQRADALALPLSRRRPTRYERLLEENARADQARAGVRAARHRGDLRRRPLLDRRGRVWQGGPDGLSWRGSPSATPAPRVRSSTSCRRSGSATSGSSVLRGRPARAVGVAPDADRASRRTRPRRSTTCMSGPAPDGTAPELLFCEERDQRRAPLRPAADHALWPKDGINDHVVGGAATVNPDRNGSQGRRPGTGHRPAGASAEIRLRAAAHGRPRPRPGRKGRRHRPPGAVIRTDDVGPPPRPARSTRTSAAPTPPTRR